MKKFISIAFLIITSGFIFLNFIYKEVEEKPQTCCSLEAEFSALANDKDFIMAHENPRKLNKTSKLGKMIKFKGIDGKDANAYFIKAKQKSGKYLFVIHEWWGLNEHIKIESEKYYKSLGKNVNVIALDLYDGNVATKREDAAKYMQSVKPERAKAIINGAVNMISKNSKNIKIATVGWCFGGGWSLQTALLAKNKTVGCIIYYGMPEKSVDKLKKLESDVLGIFAKKDKWITPKVVEEFEDKLEIAGKKGIIKQYEADHAFANPSSSRYNETSAKDAYKLSIDYLKKRF